MDEATILKQALGAILDDSPLIFPKSFVGIYEKRTDYMEGWNQGVIASMELVINILNDLGIEINDGDNCLDTPEVQIFNN